MSTLEPSNIASLPRLDAARLVAYLRDHINVFREPAEVMTIVAARAHPSYLVIAEDFGFIVHRATDTEPEAGRRLERAYRIQSALKGTPVPVAPVRLYCADAAIIGAPFYVSDHVPGRVFFRPGLAKADHQERKAVYAALAETLAALHEIDVRILGAGDLTPFQETTSDQLRRQLDSYASFAIKIEAMDKLGAWLLANAPQQREATLTHGGYGLSSLVFEANAPHVIAVTDWEHAAIADPLADLGALCVPYHLPADAPLAGGLAGLDQAALGIPSESELVSLYCHRAGREGPPDLDYFIALALFRLGVETLAFRQLRQETISETVMGAALMDAVLLFAATGWHIAKTAA